MLKLSQEMKLSQRLDFRMIQSLKLLPLTVLQLEQRISEELEMNPLLQIDESYEQEKETPAPLDAGESKTNGSDDGGKGDDFTEADWTTYLEDGFEGDYHVRQETDPNYEEHEPTQTYSTTLADHLDEQLGMAVTNEEDRTIGEFIIGSISNDGFLELTTAEVAAQLDIPVGEVERVLEIIQRFDPAGVGARDLRECLLIQLRERNRQESIAYRIVRDQFVPFTYNRHQDVMKQLGISEDQLREAISVIATLTPRPGAMFGDTAAPVVPDIIVEKIDDEYVVMLNDRHLPRLTVNAGYRRLLDRNAHTNQETRKYLVDKLNGAKWFINSIEQRRSTILRVTTAIVERQREFLEQGIEYLHPMTLQDIADVVGVAISTVQRVTTGKYMQTPRGVFELKYFFTQRIASSDGSEDFSAKSVKEKMRDLITGENPQAPLSDQAIADRLNNDGIAISRRAIAKYRDELQIPPARHRKRI